MKPIKVAILDTVGLGFNWDSIYKRSLGGSESAIVLMSKELLKIGVETTIYNNCEEEGIFEGVRYINKNNIKTIEEYDIFISQRSYFPFLPAKIANELKKEYHFEIPIQFRNLAKKAKWRIVWLHDITTQGEDYMEYLLANNFLDEVFTLSDYHFLYTIRNSNFEVIKNKFFHTRNGIVSYYPKVDISEKDKNQFIYNAVAPKGMKPLLEEVWPQVHKKIPQAKLTIIGGSYQGNDGKKAEGWEEWTSFLEESTKNLQGKMNIHFTGLITQKEVAQHYLKASYYLYPNIYPETFGISIAEGFNYNVPLIGVKFGAIEEIATTNTSYMINYSYNKDQNQIKKIIEQVMFAYNNDEIRNQKMLACNNFKDILGWDVVALQWKLHFMRILKIEILDEEDQKNKKNLKTILSTFNKKLINKEELI